MLKLNPGYNTPSNGYKTAPGVSPGTTTDRTTRAYIRPDTDATRPAWWSRHHWLHAVALAVATPEARTLWQGTWRIGRQRLWATLKAIASFADHTNGRHVAASHATIARAAGCYADPDSGSTHKVVQRVYRLLTELGFHSEAARGGWLTLAERQHVHQQGSRQRKCASTRALTLPREYAWHHTDQNQPSPLPRSGKTTTTSHLGNNSPTRTLRARKGRSAAAQTHNPRDLHTQRLAGKLVARVPQLAPKGHIGVIVDALTQHGADAYRTVQELLDDLDRLNHDTGLDSPTKITSPVGYLHYQLGRLTAARNARGTQNAKRARARELQRRETLLHRIEDNTDARDEKTMRAELAAMPAIAAEYRHRTQQAKTDALAKIRALPGKKKR